MSILRADEFTLGDRYRRERGTILLSGIQALVRLPLDRHRFDGRAGRRTGTFISGYQGSPLGTYDLTLQRELALLREHDITHVPGVNEELAATAVWGSQQDTLGDLDGRDGIVSIWYGKSPGVDRCGDVFRHANLMGVHPRGGAVVLAGDDPSSKSSTLPSASEAALAAANIPVLFPGNVQETLDLGQHAISMSRASGLWVGLKIVTNVADGFGTAEVSPDRFDPVVPDVAIDGQPWTYRQGGLALPPRSLGDERDLVYGRTEAARAYARANSLDVITGAEGATARRGIVAAGKTYYDLRQALTVSGLDDEALERAGVRLLHLRMIWPLEPDVVRRFADGLDEILVVEEKRPFVEAQIRDRLYDAPARPRVIGKRDERELTLVPADGELTPDRIVPVLASWLGDLVTTPRVSGSIGGPSAQTSAGRPLVGRRDRPTPVPGVTRAPYFCSGCPHNRSTNVPDGSVAGGGIGCHTMAAMMGRSSAAMTQMGGEGAEWIGRAPFTDRPHMFQNLGDGTFFHSGSMAIRACVSADVNITFKLLYNGAVAMTGGQDAAGAMPVPELTRLLEAEGVRRTIVCAEDPSQYPARAKWAPNVTVWSRDRLDDAQRELRTVEGVTVLVYDQACAAERRRLRKRGRAPTPPHRAFINEWVCEGCGDCGAKSNCLSVQPIETEFGRKTRIHQSSCNLDFTCLDGDCPSFVTVHETRRSRRRSSARRDAAVPPHVAHLDTADLEEPELPAVDDGYSILLTGVGGTGVVTMSQVLATAALLEGLQISGLDQTGLSQKGGPVVSHVKVVPRPVTVSNAISAGEADAAIGFDLLVAADPRQVGPLRTGTRVVISTSKVPTGSMVRDTNVAFPAVDDLLEEIALHCGSIDGHADAEALAMGLFADHLMANPLLLGVAYQVGALPMGADAIERALGLNGVAVERNQQAFRWGRRFVLDPPATLAAAGLVTEATALVDAATLQTRNGPRRPRRAEPILASLPDELPEAVRPLVELRVAELVDYQGTRLARQYVAVVERVVAAERALGTERTELSVAVARHLFKLMAYKDEYEVARLSLRPEFDAAVRAQFPDGGKVKYRLHPPALRVLGMKQKLALGRWFRPAFRVLRAMRRVRGTPLDVFGHTKVRRTERALVVEYRALVDDALAGLTADTYDDAVELASLPDLVRGYEHLKLESAERFRAEAARLRSEPEVAAQA